MKKMKNIGHKGTKGVNRFNYAVVLVEEKENTILSKHSTEKAAASAKRKYSRMPYHEKTTLEIVTI